MNRFLILLLMVGWALYIVQVNSGQTGDAVRSEKNPAACPLGSDERSAPLLRAVLASRLDAVECISDHVIATTMTKTTGPGVIATILVVPGTMTGLGAITTGIS